MSIIGILLLAFAFVTGPNPFFLILFYIFGRKDAFELIKD